MSGNTQYATTAEFPTGSGRHARVGDAILVAVDVDEFGNPADPAELVPGKITDVNNSGVTGWVALGRADIQGGDLVFDAAATSPANLTPWKWMYFPSPLVRTVAVHSFSGDAHLTFKGDGIVLMPSTGGLAVIEIDPADLVEGMTEVLLYNGSAHAVTLKNNDAGATSGNALLLTSGTDYVMEAGTLLWAPYIKGVGWVVDDGGQVPPARGFSVGSTSAPTYSSGTWATIAEMTSTITTSGGDVSIDAGCTFNAQSGDDFQVAIYVDGSVLAGTTRTVNFSGALDSIPGMPVSVSGLATGLAAGSHTFELRWSRNAGTARAVGTERSLRVIEIQS